MKHSAHEASMRAYYAARAPLMRYERLTPRVEQILDTYATFLQEMLRGQRVLEIACGTGYWTQRIAETAEHVHATDAVPEMVAMAAERRYARNNVTLQRADAYTLEGVQGDWSAGFHMQWFSHVPRAEVQGFLRIFHARLAPAARVVFGDNIDQGSDPDADGNLYQVRELQGHPPHRIIKNCPSEAELDALLSPWTRSATHRRFAGDWFVRYALDRG